MPIPSQTLTIKDPGLGLVELSPSTPILVGVSSVGTANALAAVQSPTDAVTAFGQGPLVEDACRVLSEAGGPILMGRVTGSIVGVNSAVTKTAVGSSTGTLTLSGAPFDSYDAKVEIRTTGTVGTGKFRYALDAHGMAGLLPTFSPDITIPSGGTYLIPNTNVTITFVAGAGPTFFEAGDAHTWTSTEPRYVAADVDAFFDIVRLLANEWRMVVATGKPTSGAVAATLAAGLATEMSTQQTGFRFARAFVDAGADTTAGVLTAFASFEDRRVLAAYGDVARITLKPFTGWGTPKRSVLGEFAARATLEQISTHLGRVASGSLPGVLALSHDEFNTPLMDDARISTLRTWPSRPGFYITRARLMAPSGSDFKYTHNGFVMDVACRTVTRALQEWANKSFRTTSTGTINPLDAEDIRQAVLRQLRAELTEPINAEGKRGHVSAMNFTVDLTNNVLLTNQLNTEVAIRPLGYGEFFKTQIGFALDV